MSHALSVSNDISWTFPLSNQEFFNLQLARNERETRQYKGRIDTWIVSNEDVYTQHLPSASNRVTSMKTQMGFATYAKALFAAARKGNPDAILMQNENVAGEWYSEYLDQLADNKGQYIFDAIGIQAHFHHSIGPWTNSKLETFFRKYADYGKPIYFTEISILSTADNCGTCDNIPTSPLGESYQRDEVVRFYTMVFSEPSVAAAIWWDFTDLYSWGGAPSGLLRKDMTPKPAYTALKKLIKEDWATNETLETDENGEVHLRAFRGKYQFTVTAPNGVKLCPLFGTVKKGEPLIEMNVKCYQY
jgi:GH35 family endo-1,4-beta-xylanase